MPRSSGRMRRSERASCRRRLSRAFRCGTSRSIPSSAVTSCCWTGRRFPGRGPARTGRSRCRSSTPAWTSSAEPGRQTLDERLRRGALAARGRDAAHPRRESRRAALPSAGRRRRGILDRHAIDGLSLFLLGREHLVLAKLVAVIVLLLVISGWRPRLTALPHWWVSYSFAASAAVFDGGDVVAATLTLLLLPVAFTDRRRWHWRGVGDGNAPASVAAQTGLLLLRFQVSIIYLFAAVLKLRSEEWANGTALYYWWSHPKFGAWGPLRWLTDLVGPSRLVVPMTWGVLVLELCLAFALLAPVRLRSWLLPVAVLFHVGIA